MSLQYGLQRPTGDIDVITALPSTSKAVLVDLAGQDSALCRKHGVYIRIVGIVTVPEKYEERLVEMLPGTYTRLKLCALDPYDLALSKLERNLDQDIEDVKHLARTVPLDLGELRQRYETEMRPYLARPERKDLTLSLWIDAITEERSKAG